MQLSWRVGFTILTLIVVVVRLRLTLVVRLRALRVGIGVGAHGAAAEGLLVSGAEGPGLPATAPPTRALVTRPTLPAPRSTARVVAVPRVLVVPAALPLAVPGVVAAAYEIIFTITLNIQCSSP